MIDSAKEISMVEKGYETASKDDNSSIFSCGKDCSALDSFHQLRRSRAWWQRQKHRILSDTRETKAWSRSWSRFGPLSGIASLCLAIASLIASAAILIGSDNQMVERWPTPPSTYIAVFTALSTLSIRYALARGIIVAWWRRACHGSTLSALHRDWRSGLGIRGALFAGRHMGLIGLASMFTTVILIDGPLLQRASTLAVSDMLMSRTLRIEIPPELPRGFSGSWATTDRLGLDTHPVVGFNFSIPAPKGSTLNDIYTSGNAPHAQYVSFTEITQEITHNGVFDCMVLWETRAPLKDVVKGCGGLHCQAAIQAPALFVTTCKTRKKPINILPRYNFTAVFNTEEAAPLDSDVFMISTNLLIRNRTNEAVELITGYAKWGKNCTGEFELTTCTLESGIGEYDMSIQNNEIKIETIGTPRFIARANNTVIHRDARTTLHPSTLAGVVEYMHQKWQTYAAISHRPGSTGIVGVGDSETRTFVDSGGSCAFSYRSPHNDMVNEMNKLMLYLGAAAAKADWISVESRLDPGLSSNAEVSGHAIVSSSIYRTRYWFLLAAVAVDLACVAVILPLFWEWWTLGRSVSFSPLEIAKAFKSPLLEEFHSNSTANDLGLSTRDVPIRYGIHQNRSTEKTYLAFGSPAVTTRLLEKSEITVWNWKA